jgi:hypothetical protein
VGYYIQVSSQLVQSDGNRDNFYIDDVDT